MIQDVIDSVQNHFESQMMMRVVDGVMLMVLDDRFAIGSSSESGDRKTRRRKKEGCKKASMGVRDNNENKESKSHRRNKYSSDHERRRKVSVDSSSSDYSETHRRRRRAKRDLEEQDRSQSLKESRRKETNQDILSADFVDQSKKHSSLLLDLEIISSSSPKKSPQREALRIESHSAEVNLLDLFPDSSINLPVETSPLIKNPVKCIPVETKSLVDSTPEHILTPAPPSVPTPAHPSSQKSAPPLSKLISSIRLPVYPHPTHLAVNPEAGSLTAVPFQQPENMDPPPPPLPVTPAPQTTSSDGRLATEASDTSWLIADNPVNNNSAISDSLLDSIPTRFTGTDEEWDWLNGDDKKHADLLL